MLLLAVISPSHLISILVLSFSLAAVASMILGRFIAAGSSGDPADKKGL